jgi:hypothetical protein
MHNKSTGQCWWHVLGLFRTPEEDSQKIALVGGGTAAMAEWSSRTSLQFALFEASVLAHHRQSVFDLRNRNRQPSIKPQAVRLMMPSVTVVLEYSHLLGCLQRLPLLRRGTEGVRGAHVRDAGERSGAHENPLARQHMRARIQGFEQRCASCWKLARCACTVIGFVAASTQCWS